MIICEVNKNHLNVRTRELLTAGSQNVNTVEFRFNAAWDGLAKTATFKTSKKTISVLLNTNTTAIPWEVLADAGEILAVGVFGVSGETLVLPTVWGILGKVMDAAHLGDEEKEPTPDVYQKILDELNSLEKPTWDSVQNKPFSTLGGGLSVDENGVLSAQGGGSANAVQYVAQELTDEQKAQARTNIGASPIPTVRYWLNLKADNIINLYNMGVGYGIISPVDYDQTVPTGMSSPMLVIFGRMNYGRVDITVYDGAGAVWRGSLNLSLQTTDVTKTGDYVTNTALTDILQGYVPLASWDDVVQQIVQAIGTKLDKNQGAGNAGKILGIGEDGIVVPQDIPQGGDNSLGITAAAVGQIIKVKSVDATGKPTEWEAADLDKDEYEVVAHVAITEDTSAITIDKDMSGNNLNLDECVLFIYSVGGSGNTARSNAFLYLNNQNTAVQRKKISELLFAAGKACQYTFHCKNMPYGYYTITPSKYDGYDVNYANAITQFLTAGEKNFAQSLSVNTIKPAGITSIHLYAETAGNTWGAGTWIIVQGKKRKGT